MSAHPTSKQMALHNAMHTITPASYIAEKKSAAAARARKKENRAKALSNKGEAAEQARRAEGLSYAEQEAASGKARAAVRKQAETAIASKTDAAPNRNEAP